MAIRCVLGKATEAMLEMMPNSMPEREGKQVVEDRVVMKSMREQMLGALMEPSVAMAIRRELALQEIGYLQVNLVEGRRQLVWIVFA